MSGAIAQLISSDNAEDIRRFVHHHLPNEEKALKNIYESLRDYHPPHHAPHKSHSQIKSNPNRKAQSDQESRHLIRKLTEKGFKPLHGEEDEGMKIFKMRREKKLDCLQTNRNLFGEGDGSMTRKISKYNLNRAYYTNRLADVKVDEDAYDPQMKTFIKRREQILKQLNHPAKQEAERYRSITSRYKGTNPKQPATIDSELLLSICKGVLEEEWEKTFPKGNYFEELQENVDQDFVKSLDQQEIIINAMNELSRQQLDRYSLPYIKMVTQDRGIFKKKINKNNNDLLKDAKRMRELIDFSKK